MRSFHRRNNRPQRLELGRPKKR